MESFITNAEHAENNLLTVLFNHFNNSHLSSPHSNVPSSLSGVRLHLQISTIHHKIFKTTALTSGMKQIVGENVVHSFSTMVDAFEWISGAASVTRKSRQLATKCCSMTGCLSIHIFSI